MSECVCVLAPSQMKDGHGMESVMRDGDLYALSLGALIPVSDQDLANDWGQIPLQKYVIARASGTILHRVEGREVSKIRPLGLGTVRLGTVPLVSED